MNYGTNQTPDFEQIMVERIEAHAGPSLIRQTSAQAGDERILIEKKKYKQPNASINQALLEGMSPNQISKALRAYIVVVLKRKPNQEDPP